MDKLVLSSLGLGWNLINGGLTWRSSKMLFRDHVDLQGKCRGNYVA